VSESPKPSQQRPHRGIYLLPNLLTTTGLLFGFLAIISAINEQFALAAISVFVAMVMDGLDGRVARLTNTQSDFGVQYDSLSDMVCFGVAPALVMHQWALAGLAEMGTGIGKLGWLAGFMFAACAALRLARFNTQAGVADKRYFQGLPTPAAAAGLASLVWFGHNLGLEHDVMRLFALLVTVLTALLMVSNFRYYSFKEFDFRYRVRFVVVVVLVFGVAFLALYPPMVLFLIFLVYALSGPVLTVLQRRRHRLPPGARRGSGEDEHRPGGGGASE
jgi:CDP-diacylglycerol---serine O-phosphatidyltransferase